MCGVKRVNFEYESYIYKTSRINERMEYFKNERKMKNSIGLNCADYE